MQGLEAKVKGVMLDLFPNIGIAYEKLMPGFNDYGSHTLNFPIPLTDKNKEIFGFPNRLTGVFSAEEPCFISFNTRDFFIGTIIVESCNDYSGNAMISIDEGDIAYKMKQITLKDVNYGNDVILGATSQEIADFATAQVSLLYPDAKFNFPIILNNDFYGTDRINNPDYDGVINGGWDHSTGFTINSIHEDPTPDNIHTLVPLLNLLFVISRILIHFNLKPLGSFWSNADLKKIIMYNNFPLDWSEKKYYVRSALTTNFALFWGAWTKIIWDDWSNFLNEDIDNCYDHAGNYVIAKEGYHTIRYNGITYEDNGVYNFYVIFRINLGATVLEEYTVNVLLNEQKAFDHTFTFYAQASDVGSNLNITVGTDSVEGKIKAASYFTVNNNSFCALNQYSRILHYANHIPNMTVFDFMKEVQLFFGHISFIDGIKGEHRLISYNDLFNGTTINELTVLQGKEINFKTFKTLQGFTFDNDGYTDNNFKKYSQYEFIGIYNSASDLPAKLTAGYAAKILETNKIYTTVKSSTSGRIVWREFTDDYFDVVTGNIKDEELNLKTAAAPILLWADFAHYNTAPRINNTASSAVFDTGTNDMPLRFMFYHGLITNSFFGNLPSASSLKYDALGNVLCNFSLTIEDLNNQFMSKHIAWLTEQHKPCIFKGILTVDQLRDIRLDEKYRIGGVVGFIKRIGTQIFKNHIDICEIEFLPI